MTNFSENSNSFRHYELTDRFPDDDLSSSLHKGSQANGVLSSHSKEVGLARCQALSHSVLSAGSEGNGGPGLALCLTFLNDEVGDG